MRSKEADRIKLLNYLWIFINSERIAMFLTWYRHTVTLLSIQCFYKVSLQNFTVLTSKNEKEDVHK